MPLKIPETRDHSLDSSESHRLPLSSPATPDHRGYARGPKTAPTISLDSYLTPIFLDTSEHPVNNSEGLSLLPYNSSFQTLPRTSRSIPIPPDVPTEHGLPPVAQAPPIPLQLSYAVLLAHIFPEPPA